MCGELIDYTEVITRQEIAKIPSGVYEGSYVIEEDGVVPDHTYRVKVKVTIDGSDCHLDFTGTDPQARGPINAATSQTMSGVMFALRCFMDPSIPINEGCFRPLTATLPEGTLVNPRPPAACNVRLATVQAVIDSIHQALATAFAEKAVGLPGGVHVYTMSGRDAATGRAWGFIDAHTGSEGGRSKNDGLDAQPYPLFGVDGWGISLEAFEVEYPVLFRRYGFWPDSGGPGRMRGGAGVIKQIQMLEPRRGDHPRGRPLPYPAAGCFGRQAGQRRRLETQLGRRGRTGVAQEADQSSAARWRRADDVYLGRGRSGRPASTRSAQGGQGFRRGPGVGAGGVVRVWRGAERGRRSRP